MIKVKELIKKGRFYQAEIENEGEIEKHKISEDLVIQYRLIKNKELTSELYNQFLSEANKDRLYQKVLNFALYKMRTESEIVAYLEKNQILEPEYYLNKLKSIKAIDDETYLNNYLEEAINFKKIGPIKILDDLKSKGLSQKLINSFQINDYKEEFADNLKYWLDKKVKSIKNDSWLKLKKNLIAFLMNKGFNYQNVISLLNQESNFIKSQFNEEEAVKKDILILKQKYRKKAIDSNLNNFLITKLLAKGYRYEIIKDLIKGCED